MKRGPKVLTGVQEFQTFRALPVAEATRRRRGPDAEAVREAIDAHLRAGGRIAQLPAERVTALGRRILNGDLQGGLESIIPFAPEVEFRRVPPPRERPLTPEAQRVIDMLREQGPATTVQLAGRCRMAVQAVRSVARSLAARRLIYRSGNGGHPWRLAA